MSFSIPAVGVQAGTALGGGLMDSFKAAMQQAGAAQQGGSIQQGTGLPTQVDPGPKGDGSVGLFDGVLKKALFGGMMGVGVGFIPFIPGGPLLGGVVGAIAGAGFGIFQNFRKIKSIQQDNAAFLGAVGIQPQTQEEAQLLMTGNVKQLYQQAGAPQAVPQQQVQLPTVQSTDAATAQQQQLLLQQQLEAKQAAEQTMVSGQGVASQVTEPTPTSTPPDPKTVNQAEWEKLRAQLVDPSMPAEVGGGAVQTKQQVDAAPAQQSIRDHHRRVDELRRMIAELQQQVAQLQAALGATTVTTQGGGSTAVAEAQAGAASCCS